MHELAYAAEGRECAVAFHGIQVREEKGRVIQKTAAV